MKAAGLEPVGLHELRHALASVAIAAGVTDLKRIQSWMGHATMAMTIDCYGHLLQTGEEEARAAVNAFLARERAVEHLRPRSGHAAPRSALQRGFRAVVVRGMKMRAVYVP
jgi:hypothetical protein